ncbi:hypothetical protein PHAVU_003G255000 [Phaseolus vulgaris]|uniref:Uncharacterized protein n=1 Tax=Phaseolus vulgaris TaxID=3885 RepID=V7CFJ7_PHAVU|nr:hypothetical protein PHAVU_003G255000g [Phaseolus vulgaris]ESW28055.1 hypothetical protein PHAVU_003G255000g [Phaseolus vulgaris]
MPAKGEETSFKFVIPNLSQAFLSTNKSPYQTPIMIMMMLLHHFIHVNQSFLLLLTCYHEKTQLNLHIHVLPCVIL